MNTSAFLTDATLCIGCKACEVACKEWNDVPADGMEWSGLSYDNTKALGASTWRHVLFVEQPLIAGPQLADTQDPFRWVFLSDVCKHCANAGCLEACPTGSIIRTDVASIYVQPDICNGCGYCVVSCPFGVIEKRPGDGRAFKCTFCYDRQKAGLKPACATACPTESIRFGPLDELEERARQRVADLQDRGYVDAQVYDVRDSSVGGVHALSIILGQPENYNLPPAPEVPTVYLEERVDFGVHFRGDIGSGGLRGVRGARMTPLPNRKATEERLQEIRKAAGNSPAPQVQGSGTYYGLPALKPPAWTWEVPLYFFLGGIAGVSSCIAFLAAIFQAAPALIRLSLWIGLAGAAICPILLITDLGRPSRFLNMLRVFKVRSPMSMGAWILVAFSGCALLAVAANELVLRGYAAPVLSGARWLGEASGAATGLLLASYTGVLLGATAIPVWFTHRRFLPAHFLNSGLGGSAAILELSGFLIPATQVLGFVAAGLETVFEIFFEVRRPPADAALHHGRSGKLFRAAGVLAGPAALGIRIFLGSTTGGRLIAAACFLVGALISRYAWVGAGRVSASQPEVQFALQRSGGAKP